MSEPKAQETMWATMSPDVYGGPKCDRVTPRWACHAEGDMGSEDYERVLKLDARAFPPGTRIVISEPLCPQCRELREPTYPAPKRGHLFPKHCRCGFDWDNWTLEQFS